MVCLLISASQPSNFFKVLSFGEWIPCCALCLEHGKHPSLSNEGKTEKKGSSTTPPEAEIAVGADANFIKLARSNVNPKVTNSIQDSSSK